MKFLFLEILNNLSYELTSVLSKLFICSKKKLIYFFFNFFYLLQTWTNPVGPIDCSGCGYNYTYNSKCHIFCYYTTYTIQSSNCKNPYCVDGKLIK